MRFPAGFLPTVRAASHCFTGSVRVSVRCASVCVCARALEDRPPSSHLAAPPAAPPARPLRCTPSRRGSTGSRAGETHTRVRWTVRSTPVPLVQMRTNWVPLPLCEASLPPSLCLSLLSSPQQLTRLWPMGIIGHRAVGQSERGCCRRERGRNEGREGGR